MRARPLLFAASVFSALVCGLRTPVASRPVRKDVTLLEVRLVSKVGSREDAEADDLPKEVSLTDTVWVYPVVKVALGEKRQDTVYLSNTMRIRRIGSGPDTTRPGWNLHDRLRIWNKLKNEVRVEWREVVPVKPGFGAREPLRYRLAPLPQEGWCCEFFGRSGFRRLAVLVRHGDQTVASCIPGSEAAVAGMPWIACRADTTALGWAASLEGPLPYRAGSTLGQTGSRLSCDSRSVIAFGLRHTRYRLDDHNLDVLDSLGEPVFSGYVRLGRLYDRQGKPARLQLGEDVRAGDVVHLGAPQVYGFVASDAKLSGFSVGGLPSRLPILTANSGFPAVQPLWRILLAPRTLFDKREITIRRYPPVPTPPPVKVRRTAPNAARSLQAVKPRRPTKGKAKAAARTRSGKAAGARPKGK